MTRAIILTRVSTEKQKTDRQTLELEAYCREKEYKIVKVVSSILSGRKANKRPDLDEILSMARRSEFDLLIVTEISRISRKPEVLQSFIATLRKYEIPVLFKNLGLMSIDLNGRESFAINVIIAILGELAAEEVRQLSDRVRSGLELAKAKGKIIGRPTGKQSPAEFLRRHKKTVKLIQSGRSISETAAIVGKSYNTCKKVRSNLITIS